MLLCYHNIDWFSCTPGVRQGDVLYQHCSSYSSTTVMHSYKSTTMVLWTHIESKKHAFTCIYIFSLTVLLNVTIVPFAILYPPIVVDAEVA